MLAAQDRLCRNDDLAFRVLAGETVLVHARNREVHVLNETATRVWELLAEPRTVGQLCAQLVSEFASEGAEVERDLMAFLQQLEDKALIGRV